MTKKPALLLIVFFFLVGMLGTLSFELKLSVPNADLLRGYGLALAQLFALIFMIAYGQSFSPILPKILFVLFFIPILIGAWAKIVHLIFADRMIFFGCYGIVLMYTVLFFKKKNKQMSDYLKMIWVIAHFGLIPLFLTRVFDRKWLILPSIIFSITFLYVVWEQWKLNRLQDVED